MRRREFIAFLGSSLAGWPFAARAQHPTLPVIGFMSARGPEHSAHMMEAFHLGLKEGGFVEGQNVAIEFRWARGQYDLLPGMAADLVRRQVALLFTTSNDGVLAAKQATATIPIVFVAGGDPVALGFVASLNRPGGNITG